MKAPPRVADRRGLHLGIIVNNRAMRAGKVSLTELPCCTNSDQRNTYASEDYQKVLEHHGITCT